jgi:hypothetical protein
LTTLADLTELARKVYGVKTVFLLDKDCIFLGGGPVFPFAALLQLILLQNAHVWVIMRNKINIAAGNSRLFGSVQVGILIHDLEHSKGILVHER